MRLIRRGPGRGHGQALVEFALVFPFFLILLFSIITFGLYIFYNQELQNAAREAARYAVIHSSTAQCPTVSWLDPHPDVLPATDPYNRCDAPEAGWPKMTGAARAAIWGMAPNQVSLAACWSGYVDGPIPMDGTNNYDARPDPPNTFANCTINRVDPRTDPSGLACPAPATIPSAQNPKKADGDDKASDIAVGVGNNLAYPTTVTVYVCFVWRPPMAGFVIIPNQITLRAVLTQALQRQR